MIQPPRIPRKSLLIFALFVLGPAAGCGGDTAETETDASDAQVRAIKDAATPRDAAVGMDAEGDLGLIVDCEEGESRPCGTDEGACTAGTQRCVQRLWRPECEGEVPPSDERCNGVDDDCDGRVDEGFALGGPCKYDNERGIPTDGRVACDAASGEAYCAPLPDCNIDADGDGSNVCEDCDDDDPLRSPGQEERCDGKDNDCDGRIDEGFALSEICYAGEGVCRRGGRTICHPLGRSTACDAVAAPAGPELCGDGLDNDCDGRIDEGFDLDQGCTAGTGACAVEGVLTCADDGLSATCSATPGAPGEELCGDGVDDDCDGRVDEGFEVDAPCETGLGICAAPGRTACRGDGRGVVCLGQPGEPGVEQCGNGLDDDCDGRIDEGFDVGAVCAVGVGACARDGRRVCTEDGLGSRCDALPAVATVERCGDAVDNDCDGLVDEGFGLGTACVEGVGACQRPGVIACANDGLSGICDAVPAAPEIERCNGRDDDCDGRVDEAFADLGAPCQSGVGLCAVDGVVVCAADGGSTRCGATAGVPVAERCDGQDNDCDGRVDEAFPGLGGACDDPLDDDQCALGVLVCDADRGVAVCQGDVPQNEVCNYQDDDCDGQVDEDFDLFSDADHCGACDAACAGPSGECIDATCFRTYWVSAVDGSNAEGDGSAARPWRTITFALAEAVQGGGAVADPFARIYVRPGTYSGAMHATENETFPLQLRDDIQIVGAGPSNQIILDGRNLNGVISSRFRASPNNLLRGLTLQRGAVGTTPMLYVESGTLRIEDVRLVAAVGPNAYAAAHFLRSRVWIDGCVVTGNESTGARGIMLVSQTVIDINACTFTNNRAGGALDSYGVLWNSIGSTMRVTNSVFMNNIGNGFLNHGSGAQATLLHNTFSDHVGSAIYLRVDTSAFIANNVFAHNQDYGVIEQNHNQSLATGVVNNLFHENARGAYRLDGRSTMAVDALNQQDVASGNLVGDPLFTSRQASNARLRAGSACVDRAHPDHTLPDDADRRPRPRGPLSDVGAYESFLEP